MNQRYPRNQFKLKSSKWLKRYFLHLFTVPLFVLASIFLFYGLRSSDTCLRKTGLQVIPAVPKNLEGRVYKGQINCYEFKAEKGQILQLITNVTTILKSPYKQPEQLAGNPTISLSESGTYSIQVKTDEPQLIYKITLTIYPRDYRSSLPQETEKQNPETPLLPPLTTYNYSSSLLTYNVTAPPPFKPNSQLQAIVEDLKKLAQARGLPLKRLSISLVNLTQNQCCGYASYLHETPRYPASIVKLFWLVILYSQYQALGISPENIPPEHLKIISKMIQDSDNETASIIFDKITQTKSSVKSLSSKQLNSWLDKRYALNNFFIAASYSPEINISQKTFPISHLMEQPTGPDLQIRQTKGQSAPPIRNALTTQVVARLLYELDREQAISPAYSQAIKQLIKRDLNPPAWQDKPFNPIDNFFAESLPTETNFLAKMGWTFNNRNDAAIITSPDGRKHYILVVFGDDPKFYQDREFFPKLSRRVYEKISQLHN